MKIIEHTHDHSTCQLDNKQHHLHGVVCSASCNAEEHERVGFSNSNYFNFSTESIYEQLDCGVKAYLDLQDTLF